ncbi:PadR family transcriptional regulator [Pseudonocardia benzenivorans]|uniref:Transcriptional regulator, PadR-like family n=2 Tax=Pseudonocardia TaxID=1847 RepID=F4CVV9_PSEUX|nr:PadR family transcriptional regulator [Pseudonocardia dioxanivorans]AEA25444.1 transcriptional regulator, PadR-like family [Pseudonocardia dioxanivorans CB1190]GJF02413.1 PadR family transcriptional regulator [Pseudonocardia sp. D17]
MARKRKVRNLLGLAVLAYLLQRPMHPYEISRTLRDNGDDRSIKFNHGSLYMVVGQLAKAGFVEPRETSREGQLPERTVYALTDSGRAELHDWLADLVAEPGHEYPQFVAALSLVAALPPGEVVALLGRRRARLAALRAEIVATVDEASARGVPELFLVEEQYRLALLDAEAAFVDGFVARTTDPDSGWGPEWARFHRTTFGQGDPS